MRYDAEKIRHRYNLAKHTLDKLEKGELKGAIDSQLIKMILENAIDAENDIEKLKEEINKLEERLERSPYGDDRIDQLESAIDFLKHDIKVLKEENKKLKEPQNLPNVWHYQLAKRIFEDMPEWKKEIYEQHYNNKGIEEIENNTELTIQELEGFIKNNSGIWDLEDTKEFLLYHKNEIIKILKKL